MAICPRCNQEPQEQIYHAKQTVKKAHPVGTQGKHISRMICACGCKSVRVFHVIDYDRARSHATTSLLFSEYFDLKSESKNRGSINGYA